MYVCSSIPCTTTDTHYETFWHFVLLSLSPDLVIYIGRRNILIRIGAVCLPCFTFPPEMIGLNGGRQVGGVSQINYVHSWRASFKLKFNPVFIKKSSSPTYQTFSYVVET